MRRKAFLKGFVYKKPNIPNFFIPQRNQKTTFAISGIRLKEALLRATGNIVAKYGK